MCVRSFSFNYCGFCGFFILFYFNSRDVWPLSNCFEGFASSIALKRTLGFQQLFVWLLVIRIHMLFHCSLSFFSAALLMLFFSVRMGCSFSYWWSKLLAYFIALWFSFHPVFLKLVFFLLLPGFNGFFICFVRLSFFHCTLDNIGFCLSHFRLVCK